MISEAIKKLRIWLPTIRAGSGADVFTLRLGAALENRGVEAVITWFPHWCELVPDVMRLARAPAGTDIIHANSSYAFAFQRKRIPLVVTEHHYTLDPAYRPYKTAKQDFYHRALMAPYLRRSYAAADAITTDCLFTARVLEVCAGVFATKTIPLWANYEDFSPAVCSPVESASRKFRLLFVGNASRRKGADIIPLLASRLGDDFEIRCTGGLRHQKLGVQVDNVQWLERLTQQELVREYRDCDAVLVPSRYEGFGYAALEAMACAKPVVGFRCGAIEEVVAEGETGFLCNVDDVDTLANNCRSLASNHLLTKKFGHSGRERAVTVFSEAKAIDEYIRLYRSLIN